MQRNHLLLIGIDRYVHQKKLNSCVRDCEDFKGVLLEKYDFISENIVELYNEGATNKRIQDELKRCVKSLQDSDNLIIYFSGHGGLEKSTERGFWIPVEASEEYTTWIPNETILFLLKQISARHILMVADSCFSRSILMTDNTKGIFSDAKDYDLYSSRWALTSGADETADGGEGENSLFAETIIEYLRSATEDFRVGALIEYVKERFKPNIFQKPQGYPLNDDNHKGGEFIFRIVNKEALTNRQLRGYKDFLKVLQLYKRNARFESVGKHENKTTKIGYEIYQQFDKVQKKVSFYLYLYEGVSLTQTLKDIREKHSEILREKNLIILFPKEKAQINHEIRKQHVNDMFKPLSIYYIDDFIRDECTPSTLLSNNAEKYLELPNFILPTFSIKDYLGDTSTFFKRWLNREHEPIIILKGVGGIGKTTFAQFIADQFVEMNPQAYVLFIDSTAVKAELAKNTGSRGNIDVYDFYEALYAITLSGMEKLSEDLFRINLDVGNFLLIIDGLDEIISKVPRFNVDDFLNSIIAYTSEMGNGKVIITCRTYFWEISKYDSAQIKVVDLLPFDEDQAEKFFEKSFVDREKAANKVGRGMQLAREFKSSNEAGEDFFHPFVLDIIRSIVDSGHEYFDIDVAFQSNILQKSVKNDYIIFKVCDRERKRVGQIPVDQQLKFFLHLANKRRGIVRIENLKNDLFEVLQRHIDDVYIEAFKSHPFLQIISGYIKFRYDFFADYFKAIYISNHLMYDSDYALISEDFLQILSEHCWYGSGLNVDVKNRINAWDDDDVLKCSDIVEQISITDKIEMSEKRKCIAGVFNLCLSLNGKFKSSSIESNTELMKALFERDKNQIENMHIINMYSSEEKTRFDFRSLILKKCFIDNYQYFWHCNFNNETYFLDCDLLNIDINQNVSIPIPQDHFQNCNTDGTFTDAFKKDIDNSEKKTLAAKDFMEDFLKLFFSRGRLQGQTVDKQASGRARYNTLKMGFANFNRKKFEFSEVIDFFVVENFIELYDDFGEKKARIKPQYTTDVTRFIKDGIISIDISDIISKFAVSFLQI